MSKSDAIVTLVAGFLILGGLSVAHAQESSPYPPKDLKKVGDHWTAWDPPAPGVGDYIIVRGDTLWDLAGRWLGDPFLWPQVWDENRYILDSHWIYPGDPLVVPGRPTVVPEEGPPVTGLQPLSPRGPAVSPGEPMDMLLPAAEPRDLYCSGYIEKGHVPSELWVAGRELEHQGAADGDVIYLNRGADHGVRAGDEFAVIREEGRIEHPSQRRRLGSYVRRLGKVRVLITQDESATAVIERACEDIRDSDELVPWAEIPIPRIPKLPSFDRYDTTPSAGAVGEVVLLQEGRIAAASGHIIHVDLGQASGVEPGTVLRLYRDRGELPRAMIGLAVVLTVESATSTAKIAHSVRETMTTDRVEVLR